MQRLLLFVLDLYKTETGLRILRNVASVSNAGNVSLSRNKVVIEKSEKYFLFGIVMGK